jgi:hypothetical protein
MLKYTVMWHSVGFVSSIYNRLGFKIFQSFGRQKCHDRNSRDSSNTGAEKFCAQAQDYECKKTDGENKYSILQTFLK